MYLLAIILETNILTTTEHTRYHNRFPLVSTALVLNNSVHIREMSFSKREHLRHSGYLVSRFVSTREKTLSAVSVNRGANVNRNTNVEKKKISPVLIASLINCL